MKIGAIWARTSTDRQTSLPDQIAKVKEKLLEKGYIVPEDRILAVDWTSLDLFSCPQFLELVRWVKRKEIQALGVLDRDRLQAEPAQRLVFLADLQNSEIELVLCQGPPILEGDMGGLLEHVLAIGKKQAVLRAKIGARDGIHDKVMRDRKPTSKHRIYGYDWQNDVKLMPNSNWDTVKLILDMTLRGATQFDIQKELKKRGIPSPKGFPEWARSVISHIARNPIYAGRYYALSSEVIPPKTRRGDTYGNTSTKRKPLEERVYLTEVEIVSPPTTWEQYLQIQDIKRKNKELAQRNATHSYLLSSLIFCDTHRGKNGQPRRYYGVTNNGDYRYYVCPVGGCAHPNLNGRDLEQHVKDFTHRLLHLESAEFYRLISSNDNKQRHQQSLDKEMNNLEIKHNRNLNADTELEHRELTGQLHPEVYKRVKQQLKVERTWIEDRRIAITAEITQLDRETEAVQTLEQIRDDFKDRLDNLPDEEWRQLFIMLDMQIHVRDSNVAATWSNDWLGRHYYLSGDQLDIEVTFGLKLKTEAVSNIVYDRAESNYT